MDTLAMHRTLVEAGLPERQADAVLKVMRGGVATRADLKEVETSLRAEIKALDAKVNVARHGIGLAVLAPLVARGPLGP